MHGGEFFLIIFRENITYSDTFSDGFHLNELIQFLLSKSLSNLNLHLRQTDKIS